MAKATPSKGTQNRIDEYMGVRQRAYPPASKRYQLTDKREARAMAKRRTTGIIRKGRLSPTDKLILASELQEESASNPLLHRDGRSLKKGIEGMARALNKAMRQPTESGHILWAIKRMDPMKLAFMYQYNMFIFDVVFDYEGRATMDDFDNFNVEEKIADLQLLIAEYDRLWA